MNRNTEGIGLPDPRTPRQSQHRRRGYIPTTRNAAGDGIVTQRPPLPYPRRDDDGWETVAARGQHRGCHTPLWDDGGEVSGAAPLTIGICGSAGAAGRGSDALRDRLLSDALRVIREAADGEGRDWRIQHSFPRAETHTPLALRQGAEQRLLSALVVGPHQAAECAAQASFDGVPAVALLHDGADLPRRWGAVDVCLRLPLELAAEHLLALGHRQIALVSGREGEDARALGGAWDSAACRGRLASVVRAPLRGAGELAEAWRSGAADGPTGVICTDPSLVAAVAAAAAGAGRAVSVAALGGRGERPAALPPGGGTRLEAVVEVSGEAVGDAVIRWVDELLGCLCLCCAGATPCDRHRTGIRLRVPLQGRLVPL